jgi:APA family basic amino acid/polyamine antiporter
MAEQRELPQFIGRIHERFKTPYVSIVLTGVVVLVLTIQSSFFAAVTIATVTRLLVYATTCLSMPVFRFRKAATPEARFVAPFGIFAAVLSVVLIGWLLTDKKVLNEALPILIAAAVGFVIYLSYRIFAKMDKSTRL